MNKSQWIEVGSVGWDGGCIIVGSPENIFKYYAQWSSKNKNKDIIDFSSHLSEHSNYEQLCQNGILLLDNFGGDGFADIYVQRTNGFDTSIKIVYIEDDVESINESQTLNCQIEWNNGMVFIGDPIATDDFLSGTSNLTSFLIDYSKKIKTS